MVFKGVHRRPRVEMSMVIESFHLDDSEQMALIPYFITIEASSSGEWFPRKRLLQIGRKNKNIVPTANRQSVMAYTSGHRHLKIPPILADLHCIPYHHWHSHSKLFFWNRPWKYFTWYLSRFIFIRPYQKSRRTLDTNFYTILDIFFYSFFIFTVLPTGLKFIDILDTGDLRCFQNFFFGTNL